ADPRPAETARAGRWRELRLERRLLSRPPGVLLDLNGVVKGQAVDDALDASGARVVSAGGDLAAREPVTVALPNGRTFTLLRGGAWQHHLIEPRSGAPAASRWDEVTVAAASCLEADVAAKAAFLLSSDGPDWLDARGLAGCFLEAGRTIVNRAWNTAVANTVL